MENWSLVVDDTISCVPEQQAHRLEQFDVKYKSTMQKIGFQLKPYRDSPFKAYKARKEAEVLGCVFHTEDLTWCLSEAKIVNFIEAVDGIIDPKHIGKPTAVKLKLAQRINGKLLAISNGYRPLRKLSAFLNIDINKALKQFPNQNKIPESAQMKTVVLSSQTQADLAVARAFIASLETNRCDIIDPNQNDNISHDIIAFTDASGRVFDESGNVVPTPPALGVFVPTQSGSEAFAGSFTLPMNFLMGKDNKNFNHHNSTGLELTAVLSAVVWLAHEWKGKSVKIVTDSAALTYIYQSSLPRSDYCAHMLRALQNLCEKLKISLDLQWEPRRERLASQISDDLTHQDFSNVPECVSRRVCREAPDPIFSVLTQSENFCSNILFDLTRQISEYVQIDFD